jgi:ribose transport system permease protein
MDNKDQEKDSLYLKLIPYFDRYGILLLLLIMIVVMHFLQPDVFLSWRNVTNVFKQISWQSMLALGVFMVIVTAGIDLSVGSIMMLSLMILAIVAKAGAPWFVVAMTPLIAGLICGLINGLGITILRMPHPFIMTLGTLYIFRGTGNLISGGTPISGFTDEVRYLGHGRIDLTWLGLEKSQYLPVSLVLIAIVYIIFWVFMNHTRTGKWIYAIGGNPSAARASGVNVNKILVIVYSLCGFLSVLPAKIKAPIPDKNPHKE